jgi:hypothetical protein
VPFSTPHLASDLHFVYNNSQSHRVASITAPGAPFLASFARSGAFAGSKYFSEQPHRTLAVPTPARMSTTPARRMPTPTGTRCTVGTTSVTRRTISARRPRLHHRLPHIQLRTRRSSSIRIRVATALRSPGISRGTAPIAAAPTAAAPPSFRRLAVRRRRERTEPAAITAFRRARAALCFRARLRRT